MRRRPTFGRDERGAVAVIAAASGAVLLGFGALAVDMGSIYLQSRKLQGMADLAAIAAARDLANAQAAAQATASATSVTRSPSPWKTRVGCTTDRAAGRDNPVGRALRVRSSRPAGGGSASGPSGPRARRR